MTEMYHVKPYYNFSNVDVPTDVMYSMKPVQQNSMIESTLATEEVLPELVKLKERQEHLLKLLDDFIQQSLSNNQTSCNKISVSSPIDLVIRVNPKKPPKSLNFFQQVLKKKFRVLWKSHVHSSVRHDFNQEVLPFGESSVNRNDYDIIITIIYTEGVDDAVVVIDPSSSIPIVGETNIARLLGRLLGVYDCGAATSAFTNFCDLCFDACDVINTSPVSERRASVQQLEKILQRSEWLCGGPSLTFVDAVASSILSKCDIKSAVLRTWLSRFA